MEAHRHFGKRSSGARGQALAGRKNAVLVAAASALLAAALIYLFVSRYDKRQVVQLAPPQTAVWVAAHAIPQGTPEAAIAGEGYFKRIEVPTARVAPGAIVDPSQVVGEAATSEIVAGQQITASDFTRSTSLISGLLRGDERAVAFSLSSEQGLTSYLAAGDTVDVMLVGTKGSEMLAQDVPVLANAAGIVVLRLSDRQALIVTAQSTKGSLWLSLRPSIGASDSVRLYSVGS